MEHPVLTGAILLLAACVAVLTLFERLRLPALLAYLLVGVLISPRRSNNPTSEPTGPKTVNASAFEGQLPASRVRVVSPSRLH